MRRFASGVLSLLVAVAVLELLARASVTFVADANAEKRKQREEGWAVFSPVLGWERKPGFSGKIDAVDRTFDASGLLAGDTEKLNDSLHSKILFVGDSNVFGKDQPASASFVAFVDSLLPDAVALNYSAPGYSSYQGRIVFKEALTRFKPDVVVVSFGFNDRRYVLTHEERDSEEAFRKMYESSQAQRTLDLFNKSYIVRAVRSGLKTIGLLSEPTVIVSVDALIPRVGPEQYRENLSEMARQARAAGIPMIFLILRDNPISTQYLRKGIKHLSLAQSDSAIESLSIVLQEKSVFKTLASLYLKQAYANVGEKERADRLSSLTNPYQSIHGGYPIRLDVEYNAIMRDVGNRSGAIVIDGAAELEKVPSVYYDFCHFNQRGHAIIANLLTVTIRPILATRDKRFQH